jgi:predicted RNA polymerase sigma factor
MGSSLSDSNYQNPSQMEFRLQAVLNAIYAAFGTGWDSEESFDHKVEGLAQEALFLGRLAAQLLPKSPEAQALVALMLYSESRKAARRARDGTYIPLATQDADLWSTALIDEAEEFLMAALKRAALGRFQIEAAIQSAHVLRRLTGFTNWKSISFLYEALLKIAPTTGGKVGYAAALIEAKGPDAGWDYLCSIEPHEVAAYQPYWAVAGYVRGLLGHIEEAETAYQRAIGLCHDDSVRRFLAGQVSKLKNQTSAWTNVPSDKFEAD